MNRLEFRAMGSRMLGLLDATGDEAGQVLARLPEWFEEWEQVLSRFRPGTELNLVNASAGRPVSVSQTLWDVFQAARLAEQATGGLVTPTILDALVSAGYDRSFDLLPLVQTSASFALAGMPGPSGVIVWDAPTRSLILPESVHLDLGGVAKGWAAQQALQRLAPYGPALVDAGGDIALGDPPKDQPAWPIGITDPFSPAAHFETMKLANCGVATSGTDYHRWLKDGIWQHHIIDPRTGLPAQSDVLAATVVAPTVMEAEAAAKAVLILGSQTGLDWLESDSGLAGVLVLENGKYVYSQNMEKYLWRN
jgi:thiamine biosynthesis lipoprotein